MEPLFTPSHDGNFTPEQSEQQRVFSRASSGHGRIIATSILLSSIFGFCAGMVANKYGPSLMKESSRSASSGVSHKNTDDLSQQAPVTMVQEDQAVVNVVKKSTAAVVSIVVSKDVPRYRDMFGGPFGFFFQPDSFGDDADVPTERQKVGGGTGFFVSSDGLIATNKHVVSDASAQYSVLLSDGSEHKATVLARDPVRDIALIKIDGSNYPTLSLGNSDALQVGQTVIAIGNSLGEFSNSVSRGIISGVKRDIIAGGNIQGGVERLSNILQTDAAINPGNSGGPLLDINGLVVGVNTAVAQGAENVGFALPINSLKRTIEQVQKNGKIVTPFVGIRYTPITKALQEANNLSVDHGIIVMRGDNRTDLAVVPGSPAAKAGIVENDIILEVDGQKITEKNPFDAMVQTRNVGDTISLKVLRNNEERTIQVQLEERK